MGFCNCYGPLSVVVVCQRNKTGLDETFRALRRASANFSFPPLENCRKHVYKALELIMKDAPTRHPFEQFIIGSSFLAGNNGFEKDLEQGIYYLMLSDRRGCMQGMAWLGNAYADGAGVEKDIPFAIRCHQMTYDRGLPNSAGALGLLCLNVGTEEQMRQATAVCMPSVIYEYYPANENVEKGLRLLREARDAGDEGAAQLLDWRETNPPHCPMALMYQQMTGLPIEFSDK